MQNNKTLWYDLVDFVLTELDDFNKWKTAKPEQYLVAVVWDIEHCYVLWQ